MHRVDMIITASNSRIGIESTVLDMSTDIPVLLRPGGITVSQIEAIIGPIRIDKSINQSVEKPRSPGMKYSHYAPNAPLTIFKGKQLNMIQRIQKEIEKSNLNKLKSAVITCDENIESYKKTLVLSLGSNKKPGDLAHNLFNCLRECDKQGIEVIYAEAFSEDELGFAIMNRLNKASGFNIIEV
jgi:L-threonylcarbamoyladenylate synthase